MKNIILALFLFISLISAKAQAPGYLESDYGVAGDSLYYSHVTDSIPVLNYAQAGADISWSFTALTPTTQSNDDYLNPATAGYARAYLTECIAGGEGRVACESSFAAATNLAFRDLGNLQVSTLVFTNVVDMDYLSASGNTLATNILGLTAQIGGVNVPFTTTYNEPDVVRVFPITYQHADSSVSSFDINLTPYGLNFIYHDHAKRVNQVDAWGSLTTPYATYSSTVREYAVVAHTDTAIYNDNVIAIPVYTTFEYAWFDPSYIGPVLTASGNIVNSQKIYTDVSYLDAAVCLTPRAVQRHEPEGPVIDVPGSIAVNFTNFSTSSNEYFWNFGDPGSGILNTTSTTNPIHIYTDTGVYNLSLVACNTICFPERCDTLDFTIDVRDSGQVNANFLEEPSLVCTGKEVHFENLSTHATSYLWNFGDLYTSTTQSPTHTYATAGTYTVTLIAYGSSGSDTARRTITVQEAPAPVIHVTGPTTFCNGDSVTLYASGGTVYHWSTGQLASSINVRRSGEYNVTATNSCGTAAATPITVTVNTPADTLVAVGDTVFCRGDSVKLQANTGDGLTYRWRRDEQIIAAATGDYYYATLSGNYLVNVTQNGCVGVSDTITVVASPVPAATIHTDGGTAICSGDSLRLIAATAAENTYQWQLNGQTINGATASTYYAASAGTYTTVVSRGSCSATSNSIIVTSNITPAPVIAYQGNPAICSGDSLYFSTAAGNGYSYQWQKSGEAINGAASDYFYASSAGVYTVIATVNGCSGTSPGVSLTVNPSPLADAGNNQTLTGCSFAPVTIGGNPTASGGTAPYSVLWTPATGLSDSAAANPAVSELGTTTTFYVLVTDANGCTATDSATVTVTGSALSATISATGPSSWCAGSGSSVTLTAVPAGSSGPYTYFWSPAIGLSATDTVTTVASPTDSGTYNYIVLVTDHNGCQASAGYTVQVVAVPAAIITTLDTTAPCQGDSVDLIANPGAGYTYQWLNNSEPINGSTNINYTTASAGTYSVSVTSGICSATSAPVTVTVRPNPLADISSSGSTIICEGSSATLQGSTGVNYSYQWYENGYGIGGATDATYDATDSASYYYIAGLNGCFEQSDSIFVTVNQYPQDSVAIDGPTQFCTGQVTTLSASTGTGYTYQWLQAGQSIPGAVSSTYGADSSGLYTVAITSQGCTAVSTGVDISVYQYPVATITGESSTNFCQGDSVTLIASSGPGYTYQWQLDGDTIDGALGTTFVANDTGSYNVVIMQNGCTSESNSLFVNVLPLPFAFATVANDGFLCKGSSIVIYASTGLNYTYQWQLYPGSNMEDTSDSLVVSAPGIYDVIITAAGCVTPSNYVPIAFDTLPTITQNGDTLTASGGLSYQWYQDSTTIIAGATSQTYMPSGQGAFNVLVTDSINCTQESVTFYYYPSGINTMTGSARISVYPNPAHDAVNVVLSTANEGNVTLKLYDLLGNEIKDIYEKKATAGDNFYTVSLSSLPQGIYMLSIYDGQTTTTQKLVKE